MALISRSAEHPTGYQSCLVVIYGDEIGRIFDLDAGSTVIGRSSKADIQLDQESISRNHAKVMNTGMNIIIRDLGTTNGTYVNDVPIEEYVLRNGDLVKLGQTIFKFLVAGNVERAYHERMYRAATVARLRGTVRSDGERRTTVTIPTADEDPGDGGPKDGG